MVEVALHRLADLVGGGGPLLDHRLLALFLRDEAGVVLVVDLRDLALVALQDLVLVRRDHDVVLRDRDAGLRREVEAELLERVEHHRRRVGTVDLHQPLDHGVHVALAQRHVHELVGLRIELLAERLLERTLDALVEDDPADGREPVLRRVTQTVLREVVERDHAAVV
jgi:hypothetical protein